MQQRREAMRPTAKSFGFLLLAVVLSTVNGVPERLKSRQLTQEHHHGHGDGANTQPISFAYCKPLVEKLSSNDQHQLRESYQQYHGAYSRWLRAARNHEAFSRGPATWLEEEKDRMAWNLTYLVGQNIENLTLALDDAQTVAKNMEQRIKAQLQRLEENGNLKHGITLDELSPCIMRKVYPSQFPDQPSVSLLLRLRGKMHTFSHVDSTADWGPTADATPEPPTGKGPEAVAAFLRRAMACRTVAPLELIVLLSGQAAKLQAATWAWQSWQTEGFVVPILDSLDREGHALNRLVSVARGSVLVTLRSDRPEVGSDLLPEGPSGTDCSWLQRIVTLYHRIPQLGAMVHGRYAFSHPPSDSALRLLARRDGAGGPLKDNMFFKEKVTSVPFQYVLYGDFMPMSFRRSAMEEVGGFDEDLPQGDEPCSSLLRRDLCLRLWKSGWRVGAHDAGLLQESIVNHEVADLNDTTRCSMQIASVASQLFDKRHDPPHAVVSKPLDVLMARVRELNMHQLVPLADGALTPCPMAQGC